mgnify:CR=1 FL=1
MTKAFLYDTISTEIKKGGKKPMKYKGFEVDDNKVDEYVEKLDISIFEACELILEESGKIEESEETTKAIKEAEKNAPRRYEKSGNRKKTEKNQQKT